jgi:FMN phosphatase YigB (HAD superfamily)
MDYGAILLDLDDTLYPYPECNEAGKRAAWKRARELGYDLDRDAFDDLYAEGRREVKRELGGTASSHERSRTASSCTPGRTAPATRSRSETPTGARTSRR